MSDSGSMNISHLKRIIKNIPSNGNISQTLPVQMRIALYLTDHGANKVLRQMQLANELLFYNGRNTRLTQTEFDLMAYKDADGLTYNYALPLQSDRVAIPLYFARNKQHRYFITNCVLREEEWEYKNYASDMHSLVHLYRGNSGITPNPNAEEMLMKILARMCEIFIKYEINSANHFLNASANQMVLNEVMYEVIEADKHRYAFFVEGVVHTNLNPDHIFWNLSNEESGVDWIKKVDL